MSKILGINISHDCAFAYFEDGILKEFYEESRFNKIKHWGPTAEIDNIYEYKALKKFKDIEFDVICFSSWGRDHLILEHLIIRHILTQINYKNKSMYFDVLQHHIHHATTGYYFSNFKEALVLVCDGGGEKYDFKKIDRNDAWSYERGIFPNFKVMESIFYINNKNIKELYKCFSDNHDNVMKKVNKNYKNQEDVYGLHYIKDTDIRLTDKLVGGYKYQNYCQAAGFPAHSEGQLMGLAAYKNKKTDLNKKMLNIAHEAQEETLKERIQLVEKAMTYSNCKNIILSGGYHLNCANNFKLVKHFPNLNFFVDPIPYDAGCAVGVVKYYENYFR
jgi:predicted NodU family carbamoyl transferase